MTDLLVRATERLAYGFVDPRAFVATPAHYALMPLVASIFPTEAMLRGWDMAIYDLERAVRGFQGNGIIGVMPHG